MVVRGMKALKISGIVVGIILLLVLFFLVGSGAFYSVKVDQRRMGPYTLAYTKVKGSYNQAPVAMGKVDRIFQEKGFEVPVGFGFYFDDPKQVPENEMRFIVGGVLEKKDWGRMAELRRELPVRAFPAQTCLVADFPLKNKLSILLGIYKVYPKIGEYLEKEKLTGNPIMEIYDIQAKKIYYLMPLDTRVDYLAMYYGE